MNGQIKIKTAGGSPAAITNDLPSVVCWVSQMASSSISHFFLRRQEKVTKKKATPVCRPCGVPCVARPVRRLRNSRYALKQSSPKSPDQPALLGGAQGKEKQRIKAAKW